MNKTKIGWCDYTWNVITGCKHNCEYCYAKKLAKTRLSHIYPNGFKPTFWDKRLNEPYKKKKPSNIFVSSMGDMWGEWVKKEWIEKVVKVAKENPRHNFLYLTKNPMRYLEFNIPKNCWCGTTINSYEDEKRVNPLKFLKEKSINTFISFEPLLGSVGRIDFDFADWIIIGAQTGNNPKQPKDTWIYEILSMTEKPIFMKHNLIWEWKRKELPIKIKRRNNE